MGREENQICKIFEFPLQRVCPAIVQVEFKR